MKALALLFTLQQSQHRPTRHWRVRDRPPPDRGTFAGAQSLFQQLRHQPGSVQPRQSPELILKVFEFPCHSVEPVSWRHMSNSCSI
jgi:hypothetical protein